MRNCLPIFAIALLMSVPAFAQQSPSSAATTPVVDPKPFAAVEFLLGAWEGEPSADKASAQFTFAYEVDRSVIVRHNHAEYPATSSRPATRHDDLLVIFREPETKALRADYWDNEGHVIHYAVLPTSDGVDLVSDTRQGMPGFRLRYKKLAPERLAIDFEIAPPGKPGAYSPYLSGTARRVKAAD